MSTSVKVKRKRSLVRGKPAPLFFQIICQRVVRRIPTGFRVFEEEWDDTLETVRIPQYTHPERVDYLIKVNEAIIFHRKQLAEIILLLQQRDELSASQIVCCHQQRTQQVEWLKYMASLIRLRENDRSEATLRNYHSTLRLFEQFLEGKDVPLKKVDHSLFKRFEQYLLERHLTPNTISFHFRILRMVWNHALQEGLLDKQISPFYDICTQVVKTSKRAVDEQIVKQLKTLSLPNQGMDFARDLFLFCYYARGMAFVDLAYLTKDNIKGNSLIYIRKKTGQPFRIELLPMMWELLRKYKRPGQHYLFPILKTKAATFKEYDHALRLQNKRLQKIGKRLNTHLSTYVARHTWASVAKLKGITDEIISESMGHTSLKTTRIYIASLDYSRIDKANKIVLLGKKQHQFISRGIP